ncbi:peptidoglycan-binding protein [Metabacillus sp. GX 13764]|uniref:peptidoglycan-binding domain-containing protein n=1 Tax=Metabacillus kandeliae TaxID=2900151 RepID=UPI001E5D2564|nr:peptidoglycan-binding domain-containing protein [Metabacillus kandeliae]MCD7036443.1 peptidoglycan-binding protein [Metabacillus kandeliae]
MKKKWLTAIPLAMVLSAPISYQASAASDVRNVQAEELPADLTPILDVAPEHQQTLHKGSASLEVRFVQTTLSQAGFKTLVDGLFGPQTDKQVRQFQANHRLAVDGIVGVETWTSLFHEHQKVLFPVKKAISYAEKALNNEDLVFSSDGVIHLDSKGNVYYNLKAQSQDFIDHGGSGTVGFYDVYQNGDVVESNPK